MDKGRYASLTGGARQVNRWRIAPGGAKLVHALLMRPIGRSQRVVRKEPLR